VQSVFWRIGVVVIPEKFASFQTGSRVFLKTRVIYTDFRGGARRQTISPVTAYIAQLGLIFIPDVIAASTHEWSSVGMGRRAA
jgi:hypothetical protein